MKYRNYNAKRALPLMAFAAMAFATSCSNDSLSDGGNQSSATGEGQAVELTASLNDDKSADTRVGMTKEESNKASFYWHKNEAILVQTKSGDNTYPGAEFTTSATTGATTATFKGTVASGSTLGTYAVYPYSTSHTFTSETALTYNLPAEYTNYKPEAKIFGTTADYPTNSTNIPLVGKIENGNIAFKHIGGLAVIRIDAMPYETGTLTVSADQQLSGNFSVDLSATDRVLATTSTETVADKQVDFSFSGATKGEVGVFYLPVATGDYTNLTIGISDSEGANAQTIPYGTLSMSKGTVWGISLTTHDGSLRNVRKLANGNYIINGHVFVDLGLSVLWAETNIGANSETDYGNYYAWGEVTAFGEKTNWGDYNEKTNYTWNTYRFGTYSNLTKYNSTTAGTTVLDKEDDAAYVNWGSSCRMPTKAEFDELLDKTNNCTWNAETVNGVYGYRVTSIKDGYTNNSIFLPASGYRNGEYFNNQGDYGYYWSSSLYPDYSDIAYGLYFGSGYQGSNDDYRYVGYAVRPVAEK